MIFLKFLVAAPAIEQLSPSEVKEKYAHYRMRMFWSIFVGYATYYLVRKNFTLATPYLIEQLHYTKIQIGALASALAVSYGLSKFFLGNIADKCNVRYFIGTGLLLSAVMNIFMSGSSDFYTMFGMLCLNGIFQGMGAPSCSIVIAKWFSFKERGTKMGLWNISHNVGGGLIAPIVSLTLLIFGKDNWQSIFLVPAFISIVIAILVFIVAADTPESVGLPPIALYKGEAEIVNEDKTHYSAKDIMFKYVLNNKYLWYLALANACVYLVRYGVLNWAPIYLQEVKHFSANSTRLSFFFFEYAAIPGSLLLGWMSDKYFKGKRTPLSIMCMVGVIIAILIYWKSSTNIYINVAISCVGIFIYGPQLLIGMNAIDIVPKFAVGTAVGFTGLMGYLVGELSSNLVVSVIVEKYGWNGGFVLIILAAIIAILLLLRIVNYAASQRNVFLFF